MMSSSDGSRIPWDLLPILGIHGMFVGCLWTVVFICRPSNQRGGSSDDVERLGQTGRTGVIHCQSKYWWPARSRLPTLSTLCVCVWPRQQKRRPSLAWPLPAFQPCSVPCLTTAPLLLSFRIWAHAESPLHQNSRRNLVVFYTHHHLLLYGKPGGLPHRGEDGVAYRLCWRPGKADKDRVWSGRGRLHHDLLQG